MFAFVFVSLYYNICCLLLKVCFILGKVEPMGGIKYRPTTAIVSTRISTGPRLCHSHTGCQSFAYAGI